MIEAVMLWNEPNNKSHWDFELDPGWKIFAQMAKGAAGAVASEAPGVLRVLGGISPIDPDFVLNMKAQECSTALMSSRCTGFRSIGITG